MSNYNNVQKIEAAISSQNFSHSRVGTGACRGVVWIYHHDTESPSGFLVAGVGDACIVDPILLRLRATSPLSPTERY